MQKDKMIDLGLNYAEAAHGVQTAKALELGELNLPGYPREEDKAKYTPKHMRTGIDLEKAETMGLVALLVDKGVFTMEEYLEYVRIGVNNELAWEQSRHGRTLR